MTKKSELKAEGMSGGQINKDSDIVDWVAKLNALKEKEAALKGNLSEKEAKKEDKSAARGGFIGPHQRSDSRRVVSAVRHTRRAL